MKPTVYCTQRLHWVLALALLLQAMVPAGFMPSSGHWVELCTVNGVVHVWASEDQSPLGQDPVDQSTPTCPWMGVVPSDVVSIPWNSALLWLQDGSPQSIIHSLVLLPKRWALPALRAPPIVS